MTIIETLEAEGHAALSAIQHGAAWLVGKVATAETSLHALEAASPLIAEAVAAGEAAATAHGVPVQAIENAGELVLAEAKTLADGLSQPAQTPTPPAAA
jgi:hypothetical protein